MHDSSGDHWPVDLACIEPNGWTSRPEHNGSRAEAEHMRSKAGKPEASTCDGAAGLHRADRKALIRIATTPELLP